MIEDVVKHLSAAVQSDPDKYQIVLTHGEAEEILAWIKGSRRDEGASGGLCHMGHDWEHGFVAYRCRRCGGSRW